MIMRKIGIDFCNNIRQFMNEKQKLQKGHQWRPPSKIVNFWARIKCNSSKWSWEKLSLISAIILDSSLMKNESYKKATNEGRLLKLSIFELEKCNIPQNDCERNRHLVLQEYWSFLNWKNVNDVIFARAIFCY